MSQQQSQTATTTTTDQSQPDTSEPKPERQDELRAAYEANVAAGKPPYQLVTIRTLGEVQWILRGANLTNSDRSAADCARRAWTGRRNWPASCWMTRRSSSTLIGRASRLPACRRGRPSWATSRLSAR
jgi:hypothetical protein